VHDDFDRPTATYNGDATTFVSAADFRKTALGANLSVGGSLATEPSQCAFQVTTSRLPGLGVELMLYAGNNLNKARRVFDRAATHRPRIRLTIRLRMRVLDEWPRDETIL
jgi:hypothetical protein